MASEAEKILAAIKSFAAEHPELAQDVKDAAEAGALIAAGPVKPFSAYDILRRLIDVTGIFGGDVHMRAKAHEAIDAHEHEHDALLDAAGNPHLDTEPEDYDVTPGTVQDAVPDPKDQEIERLKRELAEARSAS